MQCIYTTNEFAYPRQLPTQKYYTTIISRRADCVVFGDFNCPKVNWFSNTPQRNTVDSQLLNVCSDSLLHQRVLTLTRFRVNQHPSLLDLIFCQIPTPNLPYLYSSSPWQIGLRRTLLDLHLGFPPTTSPSG